MSNINEVIDSLNDETTIAEARETLRAAVDAQNKKNSQLYSRAKRAEGFEQDPTTKKWSKKESTPQAKMSNEPDYSKIAYLNTVGITHPDDQKWAQEESIRLKLPLTDILQMEHAKSKLQNDKDQRESMDGMPKGRGKGGGATQHDIDYWIDRKKPDGTYDTPDDLELATKVIDARVKKQVEGSKFSDTLYTG